jgi:hypothetical protein
MNSNQNRPVENLLEGLSQHARFLTREERKEELRGRGVDVEGFLAKAHSIIAHHQKDERLAWMKVASERKHLFTEKSLHFVSWIGKSKEDVIAAFQNLTASSQEHTLAFRNKTDLSIEDMARILDDYERLRKVANEQKSPEVKQ